jgi:hypothetical protein
LGSFWGKLQSEPITPDTVEATVEVEPTAVEGAEGTTTVGQTTTESKGSEGDKSLPDPSGRAGVWAAVLLLLAVGLGVLVNWQEWTAKPFDPAQNAKADFALFAGFYVGAQVIERLMEFIAPVLPFGKTEKWLAKTQGPIPSPLPAAGFWSGTPEGKAARAAQLKADRAKFALGVAAILGVAASGFFGLFFLRAIGIQVSPTVDTILTGVTIAAGSKPLHDFISTLQNTDNPKTETVPDKN